MTTLKSSSAQPVLAFGSFRWIPERRTLMKGETPLRLGSRAREILDALLEKPGQLVKKAELIERVWPGIVIEEGTLRVHISALRRALDHKHVENVNGLGYRFTGHVEYLPEFAESITPAPSALLASGKKASALTRTIGRDDILLSIARCLRDKRLLTVVGPGGIGKTTVAKLSMEQLRGSYANGACFVDLAAIADRRLVPDTLAVALGVTPTNSSDWSDIVDQLSGQCRLIVLDNCEHVVDSVAALTEALLQGTADVHVLATSREPLRARGESVLRLPPLKVPPWSHALSTQECLKYSACELFVEHATAHDHAFELADADAAAAADICRKLDGLPLAIELAAAHAGLFGMRSLIANLDDPISLLTRGRRTATPRQQTLKASLQWSFNLLSHAERVALHRLCVFTGSFDLDAACTAVAQDGVCDVDFLGIVSSLAEKSLIVADSAGAGAGFFRLLQTTRNYALAEMRASLSTSQSRRPSDRTEEPRLRPDFSHVRTAASLQ